MRLRGELYFGLRPIFCRPASAPHFDPYVKSIHYEKSNKFSVGIKSSKELSQCFKFKFVFFQRVNFANLDVKIRGLLLVF